MEVYYVDCGFDGFYMKVNLTQASALICMYCGPDAPNEETPWSATPYQTVHARHDLYRAAALCVEDCGEEWYSGPGEEVKPSSVIVSVEAA